MVTKFSDYITDEFSLITVIVNFIEKFRSADNASVVMRTWHVLRINLSLGENQNFSQKLT